ncbi:MAG: hypothetical protein KGL39_11915 [Patescibacteria group bacterium]|nr:hypothetical protein [Patescibacteria group bacterium]
MPDFVAGQILNINVFSFATGPGAQHVPAQATGSQPWVSGQQGQWEHWLHPRQATIVGVDEALPFVDIKFAPVPTSTFRAWRCGACGHEVLPSQWVDHHAGHANQFAPPSRTPLWARGPSVSETRAGYGELKAGIVVVGIVPQ